MHVNVSTHQQAAASTALIILASYLIVTAPGVVAAHNADSLIPVFVSLESWSLFYWGQDRFGMLLPLLARPVHDSFQNLLLQNFLSIALWLVGLTAALARLGLRSSVWWTLAIATLFVVTGSHLIRLTLLTTNQSYAPAVGLFGLAMYACRPSALAYVATVLLSVLGGWTNAGVALLTAIVTLTLLPVRRTRAITVPMFAGASVSIVAHRVLQTWAPARTTLLRWSDAGEVPRIVWAFWADCYAMAGSVFWLVLTVLWLVALARVWRQSVGVPRDDYRCLLGIAVGTFVYGVVMAVAFEGLGRHFVAALPLVVSAPVVVLARAAQSHAFSRTVMRATTVAVGTTLIASTGRTLASGSAARSHPGPREERGTNALLARCDRDHWRLFRRLAVGIRHQRPARAARRPAPGAAGGAALGTSPKTAPEAPRESTTDRNCAAEVSRLLAKPAGPAAVTRNLLVRRL